MRDDGDMTEPMNIMLLSALAKRNGRPWRTELAILERDDIVDAARRTRASVVAMSAITGSHAALLAANDRLKRAIPSVKTVIGGPFATFHPRTIIERPFDALGVGECDDAWPELLDAWAAGRSIDGIPNIVTPGNVDRVLRRSLANASSWTIHPDHLRPRRTALDELPYLDRDLVYAKTAFLTRYKRTIMAGRGCPFRCTYCFEHAWNAMYKGKGRLLQRHSVLRLCEELADLKARWDTRFIKFYDDVFPVFSPVDDTWLDEFAEMYPRLVGLPFHCLIRAEQASERTLRLLKQAGIASLTMSIESGNAFIRDYILRRDMSGEELRRAFELARIMRIPTFANTILAIPAPTRPALDDPDFDGAVDRILKIADGVDLRRTGGKCRHLSSVIAEIRAHEADPHPAIRRALGAAGVRDRLIEYDRESVLANVDLGVSFGEFPVFFPYEGTQLGAYAVEHGFFDGDYDRLHASYQTRSPLSYFSDADKRTQQNLALLGTAILEFSGSFNTLLRLCAGPIAVFAVYVFAPLPFTSLYLRLYSVAKNDMHARRIYPMALTAGERVRSLWENLALDVFKQVGRRGASLFRFRSERPGQTLGGPPSV